mgnify:CR=1 FL=1
MNGKKVNRIFLAVVLLNITTIVLLSVLYPIFQLGMIPNLILSQLIVFLPAAFGVLLAKENLIQFAGFHKIKVSSVFMTILFTWLCMPLVTLINAISMLFVDNAVASMTSDLAGSPLMATFLVMSILGPLNEELVCRGIFYQGYKRSGTMMQAMLLSALLFALLHMNFNQAAYAFAIGIIAVLLVEATGSLWSSVILHVTINMQPVLLMYMEDGADIQEAQELLTTDMLLLVISVYLVIAVVTTALAGCVLAWIAKNEKREENLRAVWKTRKYKKEGKVVTVPLLIAVIILFAVMVLTAL